MPKKWFWLVGLLGAGMLFYQVQATTPQDPLISLSYLELRLDSLKTEVKQWIQDAVQSTTPPGTPTDPITPTDPVPPTEPTEPPPTEPSPEPTIEPSPTWQVINLQKGDKVLAEAGCEMILRAGKAYAIASAQGGLADLTAGVDLTTGTEVATNHHLLIPRSDGRGLSFTDVSYLMIKGEYEIQVAP